MVTDSFYQTQMYEIVHKHIILMTLSLNVNIHDYQLNSDSYITLHLTSRGYPKLVFVQSYKQCSTLMIYYYSVLVVTSIDN